MTRAPQGQTWPHSRLCSQHPDTRHTLNKRGKVIISVYYTTCGLTSLTIKSPGGKWGNLAAVQESSQDPRKNGSAPLGRSHALLFGPFPQCREDIAE